MRFSVLCQRWCRLPNRRCGFSGRQWRGGVFFSPGGPLLPLLDVTYNCHPA